MVDFAITVELSHRFKEAFNTRFRGKTIKTVNHTLHEPLTHRPIGVSIETKRTGEKWKEAVYQVEIWTAAQFNKLEELMEEAREMRGESTAGGIDASRLPFLPVIIVQGHQWKFLAAVRYPGKRTVSRLAVLMRRLLLTISVAVSIRGSYFRQHYLRSRCLPNRRDDSASFSIYSRYLQAMVRKGMHEYETGAAERGTDQAAKHLRDSMTEGMMS